MCIGIIWNNSFLVGGRARAWGSNRSSAATNITLYCTWRPSGLTIGLHGQGWKPYTCFSADYLNEWINEWMCLVYLLDVLVAISKGLLTQVVLHNSHKIVAVVVAVALAAAVLLLPNPNALVASVLWHCWLGGRKGIRPVKKYGGMVDVGTG